MGRIITHEVKVNWPEWIWYILLRRGGTLSSKYNYIQMLLRQRKRLALKYKQSKKRRNELKVKFWHNDMPVDNYCCCCR